VHGLYDLVFKLMGCFCHQLPERSWFLWGVQLPLCVRCTALTVGAVVASLVLVARKPLPSWHWAMILLVPMSAELLLQSLGIFESVNTLRAATGLLFGYGCLPAFLRPLAAWGGPAGGPGSRGRREHRAGRADASGL
jgi:uncharacterized membrane protein